MVQKRRSRERNICTVYTQRATEEEIRRRNQEERIQNQGYGEIGSQNQGHSSQERPIQEGKMQQNRLLRLPVRRQGKRKLQQRKHKVQNIVYRKLWTERHIPRRNSVQRVHKRTRTPQETQQPRSEIGSLQPLPNRTPGKPSQIPDGYYR